MAQYLRQTLRVIALDTVIESVLSPLNHYHSLATLALFFFFYNFNFSNSDSVSAETHALNTDVRTYCVWEFRIDVQKKKRSENGKKRLKQYVHAC